MTSLNESPAWKLAKGKLVDPLRRLTFETVYRGHLPLYYCDSPNWGDALSPVLCSMLSGKPVKKMLWGHQKRYFAIGSILEHANSRAEVWGSGFVWPDGKFSQAAPIIHAVRGPRTRARLLELGIVCPEIFGDPALLFPLFYNPEVEKKYAVGIIPHFSDKDTAWIKRQQANADPNIRIIDVEGGIEEFVREVKSCEMIVSSSLHGLICADAYGVPNVWVKLSDILWGGSFKFCDYHESVGRETPAVITPDAATPLSWITQHHHPYSTNLDLRPLIRACPFIADDVRTRLLAAAAPA